MQDPVKANMSGSPVIHLLIYSRGKLSSVKKHSGVLQIAQAVADTLPHANLLDGRLGLEKALIQTLGDEDGPGPIAFIIDSLNTDMELPAQDRYSMPFNFKSALFGFTYF